MSQERKVLKALSLVLLVWSIGVLVFDFFLITKTAQDGWPGAGVLMVCATTLQALMGFWVGMRGVKAANVPSTSESVIAGSLILSVIEAVLILFYLLAFVDAGLVAIEADLPMFCMMVTGLVVALFVRVYGKRVLSASQDA